MTSGLGPDGSLGRVAAATAAAAAAYWGPGIAAVPVGAPRGLPGILSRVGTSESVVALTFDDGPHPDLAAAVLEALGPAPATFFWLGERVRRAPELARAAVAAGHEIACHGDSHRSLARLGPVGTFRSLRRARDAIWDAVGRPPRFYRPAYGWFTLPGLIASSRLGMRRTLWSVASRDWSSRSSAGQIAERTLSGSRPGAIALLHDGDGRAASVRRTLDAIALILDGLRERGLRPVTLGTLVSSLTPR